MRSTAPPTPWPRAARSRHRHPAARPSRPTLRIRAAVGFPAELADAPDGAAGRGHHRLGGGPQRAGADPRCAPGRALHAGRERHALGGGRAAGAGRARDWRAERGEPRWLNAFDDAGPAAALHPGRHAGRHHRQQQSAGRNHPRARAPVGAVRYAARSDHPARPPGDFRHRPEHGAAHRALSTPMCCILGERETDATFLSTLPGLDRLDAQSRPTPMR